MRHQSLRGEALIVSAGIFFSVESILIKSVSQNLNGIQISFFRFALGLLISLAALLILKKELRFHDPAALAGRAIAGVVSMVSYYMAVQMGNPARALLLNLTYPVFATLYGFLFFGEKAGWKEFLGMFVCLGGILLVFYDGSVVPWQANVWALVSGATAGLAVHFIRRSAQSNNTYVIYLVVCALGIPVTLGSGGPWRPLQSPDLIYLLLISVIVFVGQILMQTGYRFVSAVRGSILGYAAIPFTMLLSHIFIHEAITLRMVGGALLIFGAVTFNTLTKSIRISGPAGQDQP